MVENSANADSPDPAKKPRRRRWFQFSLRTLMIGVTLFAVVAGAWKTIGPPIEIYRPENWGGDDRLVVEPNPLWIAGLIVALILFRAVRRSATQL
jgi:hypothetical protein